MFTYNIKEEKKSVPLRKYPDVNIAENDAVAYTPCLGPHRKPFWPLFYYNFHNLILKNVHSENRNKNILIKNTQSTLLAWRGSNGLSK